MKKLKIVDLETLQGGMSCAQYNAIMDYLYHGTSQQNSQFWAILNMQLAGYSFCT
jgi:hypothetical protein